MSTTTTFANGRTLVSSALTRKQCEILLQQQVCFALGLDITATTPNAYSLVRVDWPTSGQPGWKVDEDIAFLALTAPPPSAMTWTRDEDLDANDDGETLTRTSNYTVQWQLAIVFFGPNALERAKLVRSVFFGEMLDDTLAESSLYVNPDIDPPTRTPEEYSGLWYERSDLHLSFNEAVTDTISEPTSSGVEFIGQTQDATIFDITIPRS